MNKPRWDALMRLAKSIGATDLEAGDFAYCYLDRMYVYIDGLPDEIARREARGFVTGHRYVTADKAAEAAEAVRAHTDPQGREADLERAEREQHEANLRASREGRR